MPKEFKDRNKDIVQLFRIGWGKYALAILFNIEKSNIRRLIVRDFNKYPHPSLDELKIIEEKYSIKIEELKVVDSPYKNKPNDISNEEINGGTSVVHQVS